MRPTIAQALATARLDAVDARVLLRHACRVDDAYLIAHADETLSAANHGAYLEMVKLRQAAGTGLCPHISDLSFSLLLRIAVCGILLALFLLFFARRAHYL